ncbi:MAG: hypothetical protein ACTS3T_20610 [Almyronema sp.]
MPNSAPWQTLPSPDLSRRPSQSAKFPIAGRSHGSRSGEQLCRRSTRCHWLRFTVDKFWRQSCPLCEMILSFKRLFC